MQIDGNIRTALFGLKYKWVRLLFWLGFAIALVGICLADSLFLPVSFTGLAILFVFGIPREFLLQDESQRQSAKWRQEMLTERV